MYFYLYDSFLKEKKYSKLLTEIEACLIDLSIQGQTGKLSILNDMKEMISTAVRRGTKTVVILGDDKTISKAISFVANLDVTLGIIPIGDNNTLASYLGIPTGLDACEILSRRIKEKIDIAKINNAYFAFYLKADSANIKIVSPNNHYTITSTSPNVEIYVCNFKPSELTLKEKHEASSFVPQDGYLELVVTGANNKSFFSKLAHKNTAKITDSTILPFKKITLQSTNKEQEIKLTLDGDKIIKTPAEIEVLPRKANIIVGKMRNF